MSDNIELQNGDHDNGSWYNNVIQTPPSISPLYNTVFTEEDNTNNRFVRSAMRQVQRIIV